ncbi:MAG: M1 family aminopeptidase, partial [Cyclobacteriaceae bacterium]
MKLTSQLIILIFLTLISCKEERVEKGVSLDLAKTRKIALKGLEYDLEFDIPRDKTESINAKNTIQFVLEKDNLENLYLDFSETADKLKSIAVNKQSIKIDFENEHIKIPANRLTDGPNEIVIEFVAGDLSLNRNSDYLYTLFVPDRASTCFPGFDQPDLKASITLTLKVPNDWEAISNQAAQPVSIVGDKKVYRFFKTKPVSTYQFAFAAGLFKKIADPETGMVMYYRETDSVKVADNTQAIFKHHSDALSWLKEYTAISYPYEKLDYVLIPSFQYGGMEHPGSIFYRESSLILDPSASVNQKLRRASLIAHETAHMWFGNLVTMKWFTDVWLKEVFANFMAAKIVNPQFPEINHDLRFLMAHYPPAYEIDRSAGSHPIQQELGNLKNAGTLYGSIIYQKAPIMMRNLETMMGEDQFKDGLRDYLNQYSYGNASWDDLVNSLKKFTDKDLELWNKAWIKSRGMPEVAYQADEDLKIKVTNDEEGIVWPQTFQYELIGEQS